MVCSFFFEIFGTGPLFENLYKGPVQQMHLISYNKIVKQIMSLYWYFIDNHSVVSRSSRAQQYAISVKLPSTLKNHCELKTCLTDKPDTVLESLENSEQNRWGWFFDFFVKIFCTGPLEKYQFI